ncbi:hypothetical protein BDF14DRAFT_1968521 [Spinellus fusiger]|nr:hypothetical protein BDF14DRAFT_1968521 [Spinellus fusiger]
MQFSSVRNDFKKYRDTPLNIYTNSNMKIQKRQTTDAKFKTIDGMEIGVVEIKPFNTPTEKVEEDRVRLAEISKKMLHKRILAAKKSTVASRDQIDNAKRYTFRLLKNSILPTTPNTFSHMSLSLESLAHYKKMMVKSIASASDVEKPYIYSNNHKEFEPTITLLKLGSE